MEFPRQEHWSGLPFPPPGDLPNLGTEPPSLVSRATAGGFFTTSASWDTGLATTLIGSHNPFSNFPQLSVDEMGLDRSLNNTQVKHSTWIFT